MSIDPKTLPDGAVVEIHFDGGEDRAIVNLRDGGDRYTYNLDSASTGFPTSLRTIARVFVPVPEGMTYADAEAALADAGAWVEVANFADDLPIGARIRIQWNRFQPETTRYYVHRDDLPPTDPDAELVEKMARAMCAIRTEVDWDERTDLARDLYRGEAVAALAALREHEATR